METPQYPTKVPAGKIVQGKNPRTFFDPKEMEELEASVRQYKDIGGLLQAILVRPKGDEWEIIAGERRWRAIMNVFGADWLTLILVQDMTDEQIETAALAENTHRAAMSPTEEAVRAAKILGTVNGDRDEAALRMGWKRPMLDSRLALMNCSPNVQTALNERRIQLGVAELLAAVTKDKQDQVLTKLLASSTQPSVSDLKNMLKQIARSFDSAIFDKDACAGCPHNSATQQALFSESIAAGNCTNGECFDAKTETELNARAENLKGDYPIVRIVRVGENFTLLKLQGDGATGVGEEQAKACRGCTNFGAAISGVPGKIGNVYKDLCFDATCNTKKVAERLAAEKDAAKAVKAKPAAAKAGDKSATKAAAAPAAKVEVKVDVQDSNRIKEYRVTIWRKVLRHVLMNNPGKNLVALIALGMSGNGSKVDSIKLRDGFKTLTSFQTDTNNVRKIADALETAGEGAITTMHQGLVASATYGIDERHVVELLDWLNVNLADHWKLNEEYLKLLTKSEMGAIADEIGLKAHVGKDFTKLMNGKNDEIIKSLLKVEGFEFKGKVPKQMMWTVS